MFERELQYFISNQEELYKKYGGLYISIKEDKVLGSYSSWMQALYETQKLHKFGTFLIQYCGDNDDCLTHKVRFK